MGKPSPSDGYVKSLEEDDEEDDEEADEQDEEEVEEVESVSEQGDEDKASHPSCAQSQHVTTRHRGRHLEGKRTPPPSSKRRKMEASPSSEESPAPSATTTATPSTGDSAREWKNTPSSQAEPPHSATWWLNSAWKREDELVRQQLAQSRGRSSLTRRPLNYAKSAPKVTTSVTAARSATNKRRWWHPMEKSELKRHGEARSALTRKFLYRAGHLVCKTLYRVPQIFGFAKICLICLFYVEEDKLFPYKF
eukprot:g20646.t1